MFFRQCNDCGQRWGMGETSTCTCPDEEPKREWVKLTDEEIQNLIDNPEPYYDRMFWFARTIERKLKEKNYD